MPPSPRYPVTLLRRLQTPRWTVFFVAILAISLAALASHLHRAQQGVTASTIGRLLGLGSPPAPYSVRRQDLPWAMPYLVLDPAAGWRPIHDPDGSANAVAQAIATDPRAVVKVECDDSDRATGLFDPLTRTQARSLRFTRADGAPVPAPDIPVLVRALADSEAAWMVDPAEDVSPWALSSGRADQSRTTILWRAVANNAAAMTGLLGLIWSLGWVPRHLARRRRVRRLEASLCPRCGYDRRATKPGTPCPECGSPFSVD